MLSLLVAGILAFVVIEIINAINKFRLRNTWQRTWNNRLDEAYVFGIVTLFLMVGFIICVSIGGRLEEKQTVTYTPIYNISDNSFVDGNFILGSGSISSGMKYYFYIRDSGGFLLSSRENSCVIYMNENEVPYVMDAFYTKIIDTKNPMWYFGIKMIVNPRKCEIHIPENSIVSSFVLDAN